MPSWRIHRLGEGRAVGDVRRGDAVFLGLGEEREDLGDVARVPRAVEDARRAVRDLELLLELGERRGRRGDARVRLVDAELARALEERAELLGARRLGEAAEDLRLLLDEVHR